MGLANFGVLFIAPTTISAITHWRSSKKVLTLCCANAQAHLIGGINLLFHETELRGAYTIEPQLMEDSRGFFARVFCRNEFADHNLNSTVAQCNTSWNVRKKTLRGMHLQVEPHAEVKLVRCTGGSIYDVIIDMRPGSPTFGKWTARQLTDENHLMMYVPEGFAHGYQALEDGTEVFYQVSEPYAPGFERGIRWNDPSFNIQWPYTDPILSEKDMTYEDWKG